VLERSGARAVVVTSPESGDGKTLTSINLAVAMGESGLHVVLVDADARQRGLSRLCDLDGQPGLTDLAREAAPIDYCLWLPTFTSIQVIPAGAQVGDPAGFAHEASFSRAVLQVRQHASLTVIDTPALLTGPDALAIAGHVEGVVLVIRPETSAVTLIEARQRLDGTDTRLLGYVVNRNRAWYDGQPDNGYEPGGAARALTGQADQPAEPAKEPIRRADEPAAKEASDETEPAQKGSEFVQPAEVASRQAAELPAPQGRRSGR
jgi:Mrp family chromosome partitioning ATPase